MHKISFRALAIFACLCAFLDSKPAKFVVTPEVQAALDEIRPDPLRGDLSFLASDLLEGRGTPSRGLDIAAEYIAAQFRAAGLEPLGDDGYFQTASMAVLRPDLTGFDLKLVHGDRSASINPSEVSIQANVAVDLNNAPLFKLDLSDLAQVQALTPEQVDGKVLMMERSRAGMRNSRVATQKLNQTKPAAIITVAGSTPGEPPSNQPRLIDPDRPASGPARIAVASDAARAFYASLKPGANGATVSIHIAAPVQTPVRLHNVIGLLRGSDPELKDTALLLTAHYDHLGERPAGPGDRIYNGADDDGSGTVSVIEIARALSTLKQRPRRSIIFMTFFGEEQGLVGSTYYARHPVWPIAKTLADLNLEQVGRTDSSEGPQLNNASVTGFDYSDLTEYVRAAGELTGIRIYKHPRNDDLYFAASDNLPLAQAGVPAHTLCVAYEFPDYHAVGDEWQKIDYANMAKVDRAVALAVVMLASSDEPPHWNAANPRTAPFRK
ncbi:MAG TPA: M28 family peptidase [Bryobacteraceae bacterium]|nr:M28 family peptidase [Bryobacteraceae bacterium]